MCMHHREHSQLNSRKSSDANSEDVFRRAKSIRHSVLMRNKVGAAAAVTEEHSPHSAENGVINTIDMRNGSLSTADLITNDVENLKNNHNNNNKSVNDSMRRIHKSMPAGHAHMHGHSHMPELNANSDDDLIVSSLRGLLVVLALSVHELFEGLAVGLEGAPSKVWYMMGAVSAHKLVLAFCVGVELLVTRTKKCLAITYILTFAAVSPIGIGIGILVSSGDGSSGASNVTSAILQGLACGTLLYVVFFEILSKDRSGLARYTAVLVGFFVMFGLQFLSEYFMVLLGNSARARGGGGFNI